MDEMKYINLLIFRYHMMCTVECIINEMYVLVLVLVRSFVPSECIVRRRHDVTHKWNVIEKGVHTVPRGTVDTNPHTHIASCAGLVKWNTNELRVY